MSEEYRRGLVRAAQEVARVASYVALDRDEGAAITPTVDTGTVIRAIFKLFDEDVEAERKEGGK